MNRKREELSNIEYPELEREIRETMAKTIGKRASSKEANTPEA